MKSCNTKMVYMPSDVPENLDITGFEKHLGRATTYIRTHLMNGIKLVRNKRRLLPKRQKFFISFYKSITLDWRPQLHMWTLL